MIRRLIKIAFALILVAVIAAAGGLLYLRHYAWNPEQAAELRKLMPNTFFLIPGYGAQGGAARIAATLLDKAGGTVNSSRGILCAWQKAENLAEKREQNCLCMNDIANAAAEASVFSKNDLLNAVKSL